MLVFAWVIYWLDRYEKEPLLLLGGVFLWGAIGAATAAFLVNTLFGVGIYLFTSSEAATDLATGTLIAPVVEETLKGLAVLTVFLLARSEFDSYMDGIVYAGIVALGFAASENVYYIYSHGFLEGSYGGLLWVAFVRICLVGWQHPFYTAFFGIGLALARMNRNYAVKVFAPLVGLALGIIFHSLHNTIGSLIHGFSGVVAEAAFDWSGWSLMFLFILWANARERGWIVQHLCEEVDLGLISPAQYQTACSSWAQTLARCRPAERSFPCDQPLLPGLWRAGPKEAAAPDPGRREPQQPADRAAAHRAGQSCPLGLRLTNCTNFPSVCS